MIHTIHIPDFFNDPQKRSSLGSSLKIAGLGVWDLELFPFPTLTFDENCKTLLGIEDENTMAYELAFGRIHSLDKAKVDSEVSRAQSSPESPSFDVCYRITGINDNVIRTVRSIGTFRFDDNDEPTGASGFSIHLSEEHALKKEIRKLESIVNTSPDFQGISNMNGEIEFVNDTGLRLTGLSQKGFKGMRTGDFYDRVFNPHIDEIGKGLKNFGIWKGQVYIKNFETGEQIPVYGTYQSVVDESTGLIIGRTVNLRDLRSDIVSRKALEESEQFIRSVFDDSPVAMIVFSRENMIIRDTNKSMLNIFGRETSRDFIGYPLLEAVPELKDSSLQEQYTKVLQTGITHYELAQRIMLMKAGIPYLGYYDYIFKPLKNVRQEIYGVICTVVEVTEQVAARLKVEETEARLRGAISVAGLATWSFRIKEEEFIYSERFMEWLGFDEDTASMEKAFESLTEEYKTSVPAAIAEAIRTSGQYDNVHTVVNTRTGEMRIIHEQGQIFYDDEGKPDVIHGTAQDITMERELQMALEKQVQERTDELAHAYNELQKTNSSLAEINQQLSESNNELSQYAYVASHDLQEPLRKIRFFSSLLNETTALPGKAVGIVQKIEQSSERMSLLISDLLEFSRATRNAGSLVNVDLNDIVNAVLFDFELLIREKNATIDIGRLPVISAVPLQMNQLFYNMLSNSLKFSTNDKPLKIEVRSRKMDQEELHGRTFLALAETEYYDITVTDNGIGFDKQYTEQIFEVFKRLHAKTTFPGSGIGLALCRKIVNQHHGEIFAKSRPGEGTTFHIVIPGLRI